MQEGEATTAEGEGGDDNEQEACTRGSTNKHNNLTIGQHGGALYKLRVCNLHPFLRSYGPMETQSLLLRNLSEGL